MLTAKVIAALCFVATYLLVMGYGVSLAFSANILLGLVVLLCEPLPLFFGLMKLIMGINVAEEILRLLSN